MGVNFTGSLASSAASVTEGNAVTFTVTAATASTVATTLNYQVTGSAVGTSVAAAAAADFSAINGSVTIAANATTGTFTVTPSSDGVVEGYEGFNVVLLDSSFTTVATSNNVVIADGAIVASTGSTYSLTSGTNKFTGTSGDDTFDGGLNTSSLQTLNSGDSLDGGAGTDELTAVVNGSVTPGSITNIETIAITNVTLGSIIDFSNVTGMTSLTSQSATNTTVLQGLSLTLAPKIQDSALAHTITFASATGSSDSATVSLQNVTGGIPTIAGIETLTLNSIGSVTNVIGVPVFDATTKLVVTGVAGLTMGTLVTNAALVTNVDASALAPTSGVGVTAIIAGTTASSISGSSGNDTLTVTTSAGSDSISGGAGNDSITFTAGFSTTDSVDGGAGTDTLNTTNALIVTASASTPTTYTVTNVETIATTDAHLATTITPANISATATTLNLRGAADTAISAGVALEIVGPAGAFTLGLGRGDGSGTNGVLGTDTFTITDTGTATTDSITINNLAVRSDTGAQLAVFATSVFGITGYETVTINNGTVGSVAQTLGAITLASDSDGTETLVLTGANNIELGIVTADIIDASALTSAGTAIGVTTDGTATLFMVTGSTAQTITGSAGIDNLFGNTTSASSISGGTGADSITGGTAGDTLLGGAGADSIVSGGGNDSIDAGAGNDTVFMVGTLNAADTIIGGDGTDTLSFDTTTAHTAAIGARVSEFETLTAASAVATLSMAVYSNNTGFTRVNVAAGTNSITNAGAAVVTLGSTGIATALTFARATDTTADALNIRLGATTGASLVHAAVTASGEETITLTNAATSNPATFQTITTLSAAAATTLNIAGSGGMVVTNAITGATALATVVDSHSGIGVVTLDLSNSTVATTYTGSANATGVTTLTMGSGKNIVNHAGTGSIVVIGGSAAESMTGSSGADTLSGGSGADTLAGGSGADSISGGSGADSISGGAGDDTMSTDSGADTIDGGDGTDILVMSAAFTDLSADTITNVETLNMATYAGTMSIANLAAFTTVSNVGVVTLSDAGTVAGNSTVLSYVLAAGTNTFTSSTTALTNSVTGNTGADTFNFGLLADNATQSFLTADVINGGTGSSDVLNFTGNIAFAGGTAGIQLMTNVTNVESIVFANTTKAVTVLLDTTNVTTSGILTVDVSSSVSGIATITATAAPQGVNIISGAAADVLIGSAFADTISSGAGIDFITGGTLADNMTGGIGVDTFVFADGDGIAPTATGIASGTSTIFDIGETLTFGNGVDIITDFTAGASGDIISGMDFAAAPTAALSLAAASVAGLAAGTTYYLSGNYVASTGVFTITANAGGADTLILEGAAATPTVSTDYVVLVGVVSSALVTANFIA